MKIKIKLFFLISTLLLVLPEIAISKVDCKNCNLIVIDLTSTRKKNMSYYGYSRKTTPNIDNFFANSYSFENAFAAASLTYIDEVSFFYSLAPSSHGAFIRGTGKLIAKKLKDFPNLPSVLSKAGYKTAAFVSDEDYSYDWGIGKDFDLYFDRTHYVQNGIKFSPFTFSIGTKQLLPHAINWLERNKNSKFFLFLQSYEMHCPYTPEGEFEKLFQMPHSSNIPFTSECFMTREPAKKIKEKGKEKLILKSFFAYLNKREIPYAFTHEDVDYLISRYDAELAQADDRLKSLFSKITELGLDKNSLIVLMSDHGDNFGENGYFMKPSAHALGNFNHANLNIPLIIKTPGQKKSFRQNQLVHTIDIAPSLLDMLKVPTPPTMEGKSFNKVIEKSQEIQPNLYAFTLRYDIQEPDRIVGSLFGIETLFDHDFKIISSKQIDYKTKKLLAEKYYFFDLKKDEREEKDLSKKNHPKFAGYLSQLKSSRKAIIAKKNKSHSLDSNFFPWQKIYSSDFK